MSACVMSLSQSVSVFLSFISLFFLVSPQHACLLPLYDSVPSFFSLPNSSPVSFRNPSLPGPLTFNPNIPGGMQSGEMAEGGEGTCPKVFVVDSQANYISMPSRRESKWVRAGQKYLFLLVGLAMLGLVVEGCLIYNLYKKTQVRLTSACCFCLCV